MAEKYNQIQEICLRVNSQKYASKLGIILNDENITKLKSRINDCHHIKIKTLLSHYTTQMNNSDQFKKNIRNIAENLIKLSHNGIYIDNINLGGGFPEATVMPQKQLKKIALDMKMTIEKYDINYKQIYFEPGRYFVGDAGLFLAKIIKVGDGRWIFLNIGNHICPKFARCSLRFYNADRIEEAHKYKVSILGNIPTDQDVLAKDYFFTEKLNEGDKVIITNAGAYTLTFSNRFPYSLPNIFLVKDNKITQIFSPSLNHDFSLY
jgi:diaminopimelate decarboxylase